MQSFGCRKLNIGEDYIAMSYHERIDEIADEITDRVLRAGRSLSFTIMGSKDDRTKVEELRNKLDRGWFLYII